MYYPSDRKSLNAKMQAPFVLAEIRALRSSIFKKTQEVQSALAIAEIVERQYELDRVDLFIPAGETWCAILEPFAMTVLTGTLRRIGYEIFPQYVSILGIPPGDTAIDWNQVIFKGLTLKGIYGREMFETWYKMSSLLQSGLNIDAIITHHFAVQDFKQGFETMGSGKSGKVILDWSTL